MHAGSHHGAGSRLRVFVIATVLSPLPTTESVRSRGRFATDQFNANEMHFLGCRELFIFSLSLSLFLSLFSFSPCSFSLSFARGCHQVRSRERASLRTVAGEQGRGAATARGINTSVLVVDEGGLQERTRRGRAEKAGEGYRGRGGLALGHRRWWCPVTWSGELHFGVAE